MLKQSQQVFGTLSQEVITSFTKLQPLLLSSCNLWKWHLLLRNAILWHLSNTLDLHWGVGAIWILALQMLSLFSLWDCSYFKWCLYYRWTKGPFCKFMQTCFAACNQVKQTSIILWTISITLWSEDMESEAFKFSEDINSRVYLPCNYVCVIMFVDIKIFKVSLRCITCTPTT